MVRKIFATKSVPKDKKKECFAMLAKLD